jgi:hydrogenase maturation protease
MHDEGGRLRIIGIGSPFGDDALGLEVARRLAARVPAVVDVVAADRPGERLLDLFAGCDAVILVDAARRVGQGAGSAGAIHDMDLAAAADRGRVPVSSHGLGVAQTIALAHALGRLPRRGRLLAVEFGAGRAAEPALAEVCARALRWAAAYLDGRRTGRPSGPGRKGP